MDDIWMRFVENMNDRVTGPMKFRLLLQPAMAAFFAIRAGLNDARTGKPPYFWSLVTDPAHPNCIGPGKRPLHTIIPAMACENGRPVMPFGVMGGDYQPSGHVAVALNMFVYGMDPQAAIDHPRLLEKVGVVEIEDGVGDAVAAGLAALGHRVARRADPLGGGQAIVIDRARGVLIGGSDPRKDGAAAGL